MPEEVWIPKFNTSFVEPLVSNLLTWVKEKDKPALKWANGGLDGLPEFSDNAVYNSTAALAQKNFPDLMVWKVTSPMLDEGDHQISELHHITLCFELVDTDQTQLVINQWRYMKALDSICRDIPSARLYEGVAGTKHGAVEVIRHDYGMPRKFEKEQWLVAGMLTVAIAMAESRNNDGD